MTPVKSMPTNTIDRNCDNKEHETTGPSCLANSFALITEREDPMNVNDLPAKLCDAFWPPPNLLGRPFLDQTNASVLCRMTILYHTILKLSLGFFLPMKSNCVESTFDVMFKTLR
jgi:hypothetical protein